MRLKVDGAKGHKVDIEERTRRYVMCAVRIIIVDETQD